MSSDSFKVKNSLNIDPKASPTLDQNGDIAVDSSDNKLKVRLNASTQEVVTNSGTHTLTNKTIDADSNTITNIENADIKAAAAIDASKIANGSVSNTEFQYLDGVTSAIQTQINAKANSASPTFTGTVTLPSSVVSGSATLTFPTATGTFATLAGTEVITNKDIDGGTAANTRRITLPKDIKTNLDALTRKQGTLLYDTTSNKPYYDDGTNLKVIGSGSGGAVNYIDDGDAEAGNIFSTYALTEAVTFQDTGDTVTLTSHGLQNGQRVSFSSITSTTGISTNTAYFVISAATNTFQLASTSGGSALALTTNGSGTMRRARPVTGTGGSPGVTASTTSVSPLSGTNSFTWAKDAANRMGEGFSRAFTVPISGQAKVLEISFDYIVNAGTFAAGSTTTDSDLIVYIYDVTNSTLIEPSSIKLLSNSSTISDRFIANFQTSATGTSYRLLIHVANPSTSSFTIEADSIRVGPCNYVYGTPITDWATFTSGNTQGFGTITSSNLRWRRVGDTMQIQGGFISGTVTGSVAQLGLPSGNTIGGITGVRNYAGEMIRNGGSRVTVFAIQGVTYLTFGGGAASHGDVIGSSLLGSTEQVYLFVDNIPIQGWSSSVQVSDGYDGRLINARYTTANTSSIANATFTMIDFGTKVFDSTNAVTGAGGGNNTTPGSGWFFTCPSSGTYRIGAGMGVTSGGGWGAAESLILSVYRNSVEYERLARNFSTVAHTSAMTINGVTTVQCNAGDKLQIAFYQDSGAALNMNGTGQYVDIEKLQAPTTISATEVVSFSADTSTTAATTSTPFLYTNILNNSHGAYSSATGRFTAPYPGFYSFVATAYNAAAHTINIYKNGVSQTQGATPGAAANSSQVIWNGPLNAGDTIEVRPNSSVTASGSATLNMFSGFRVK